jgi:thymidylate synthase ThyX
MIEAKIIADSLSPREDRLTTIECKFPRFILPEVNTHRMISKSAKSSRAIPLSDRIAEVREHPYVPIHWGKSQKGMVAESELDMLVQLEAESVWREAAQAAADYAEYLGKLKLHKQTASRILEPYIWQVNVMSSTDFGWKNLIKLRDHPDAQPEFRELAKKIRIALDDSRPKKVAYGQMHLPYISDEDLKEFGIYKCQKASVARVARTSYGNQGGWNIQEDLNLERRLFSANPRHDAPYEMPACPSSDNDVPGNYQGWSQLRHNLDWQIKRMRELKNDSDKATRV